MKRKLLTTTLLSLNLSAAAQMKCTGDYCLVDLSSNASPKVKEQEIKKEDYKTVMIDNIETIVFSTEKYVMNENEIFEYDLEQMKKINLTAPSLNSNGLEESEAFCEDNFKPIKVAGIANTYECTPKS